MQMALWQTCVQLAVHVLVYTQDSLHGNEAMLQSYMQELYNVDGRPMFSLMYMYMYIRLPGNEAMLQSYMYIQELS